MTEIRMAPAEAQSTGEEADREHCFSLWIGAKLPPRASACLSSFVEMGHNVDLYVYDEPQGVPPGITLKDASVHISPDQIIGYKKGGSPALFADRFRYELLAKNAGLWIDTDILCIRPIRRRGDYVFGFESDRRINNAVLRAPSGSAVLSDLRSVFRPRWVPPWYTPRKRAWHLVLARVKPGYGVSELPWGSTGPSALTHFATQHGLIGQARPEDEFYPLPYGAAVSMAKYGFDISRFITDRTQTIHLWAEMLSGLKPADIHPNSFLAAVSNGTWRGHLNSQAP